MKKRLRRLLVFLIVLGILAGVAYGASWLNARRFYLVVGPATVEIGKGRMLPVGWEPYRPDDPTIRRAYRGFDLPGGIKVARGTTIFTDRVELDQALYRLLTDAARYAMSRDTARSPELVQDYLERLEALPGISVEQQVELQKLERRAEFARGRQFVRDAVDRLERAEKAFEASAGQDGPETSEAWAELSRRTRAALVDGPRPSAPVSSTPETHTATMSTQTATRSTQTE